MSNDHTPTPEAKRAHTLKRLAMEHDWEALLCVPKAYVDCTSIRSACLHESERPACYRLTFTGRITSFLDKIASEGFEWRWKPTRISLAFEDAAGNPVQISMFGNYGPWVALAPGTELVVSGPARRYGSDLCISAPMVVPPAYHGRMWPQYRGIPGRVSKDAVEAAVLHARSLRTSRDECATKIRQACGDVDDQAILEFGSPNGTFSGVAELIEALHEPRSLGEGAEARAAAARISALSVRTAAIRASARPESDKCVIPVDRMLVDRLAQSQPEQLTEEQLDCVTAITRSLLGRKPLVGLLSGEVGSGKTLVYAIPAVAAHLAGAKCAIIAPTEILADQIADQLQRRFVSSGASVERVRPGTKIQDQQAILVGTHGLSSVASKAKYRPALLICDEQHKMGVAQKEAMLTSTTHLLEVSATPMPRTIATAIYGGYEVFTLSRSPVPKRIHSHVIDLNGRPAATAKLREVLARGDKAAIIYPVVCADDPPPNDPTEEDDQEPARKPDNLQSVLKAAALLEQHFPGKVSMVHGGMTSMEKRIALDAFRANERPLVVASTIMETGIDVPSISAMIVRDADRFGAAQLHQLRGRLARNGGEAHFIMMVKDLDSLATPTLERLAAVASTSNGFELAQKDMLTRGFGSIGTKSQSGSTEAVFRLTRMTANDFLEWREGGERPVSERERSRG